MRRLSTIALSVLLLASGCTSKSSRPPLASFKTLIKVGHTEAEVEKLTGKPDDIVKGTKDHEIWAYKGAGGEVLTVSFKSGVVKRVDHIVPPVMPDVP